MVEIEFNCPERKGEMSQGENGFFCASCEKIIVDYSGMSNEEIADKLKANVGKQCGVFNYNQVINPERSRFLSLFRLAIVIVFFLGIGGSELYAQEITDSQIPAIDLVGNEDCYTIRGQVTGNDSLTVPFARVWVKIEEQVYISKTDLDGNYKIEISDYNGAPLNLYVKSVGYDTTMVSQIVFNMGTPLAEVNVALWDEGIWSVIGIVTGTWYLLSKDPYEIGKTTISEEDIRHRP